MKISEFSVKNSLVVNCLSIFVVIMGLFALRDVEREAFPNFSFDIVIVTTDYAGASPEVIEKRITLPLEKELKEVDGLDELASISIEGLSLVVMKLDPDAPDHSKIFNDIQKAVEDTQDLPEDLRNKPKVRELNTKDQPIVEIALSGPMPEKELREIAKRLETEILDLKEVSGVARRGMRDPEIWVELKPEKMREYELALPQVFEALALRNVNVPGGLFKGKSEEWIIRTSGELETPEDVKRVILRANEGGNWVQVSDVAEVKEAFEESKQIQRTDGTRSINLWVIKKDKADAIRLMEELKDVVKEFQSKAPAELKASFINDFSYYIKRRLNVLVNNGLIGFAFVIAAVLIFLSPRVAIGAALGIPVAILSAVLGMRFLGISINLISMFGIIMVIGMLVDEDMVVAENISRYLEKGYSYQEAAIKGASEVQTALISVVLTTIIAFIPLLMMSGIFGKFVSDIPKVVMITLAASLIEALLVLPSHLAELNRPRKEGVKSLYQKTSRHRVFDRVKVFYGKMIRRCLDRPLLVSLLGLAVTGGVIFYGVQKIPFILFPSKGIEAFFLRAQAPLGTPLETTEELIQPLEKLVGTLSPEELDHQLTQIGIHQNDPDDPFTLRGSHLAQIMIFLTPEAKRGRDAGEIMESLRSRMGQIPGLEKITFEEVNPGAPVGKPVAVRIRGENFERINTLAEKFKKALSEIPGVQDIRDDFEPGKGELKIIVNEQAAQQARLSFEKIARTVRLGFEGVKATTIRKGDDEIDILVRLPEKLRHDPKALESLLIMNEAGNLVPLHKVARLEKAPGIAEIKHYEGKRAVTVTANVDQKITTSRKVNETLKEKMKGVMKDSPGYFAKYGGEYEDTEESMQSLYSAFLLAVILIFFVLLMTFGSVLQTLILLLTIPFGAVGVILGFKLSGEPFSFLAMLGMVGLTGVVVDAGTLLFTFINERRKEGAHLKEAIVEACETRLRPIFLTTLTTVVGVIPAAYGIGGSDPFIQPMALALNWGVGVSVLFTMFVIPCFYYLVEHGSARLKHYFKLKSALGE